MWISEFTNSTNDAWFYQILPLVFEQTHDALHINILAKLFRNIACMINFKASRYYVQVSVNLNIPLALLVLAKEHILQANGSYIIVSV